MNLFFLAALEFELRASHLLRKHSTTVHSVIHFSVFENFHNKMLRKVLSILTIHLANKFLLQINFSFYKNVFCMCARN
jgi:hypothetical protein